MRPRSDEGCGVGTGGQSVRMTTDFAAYIIDRSDENADGCWIWRLSVNRGGYAQARRWGRLVTGHRLAYETFIGPVPVGSVLDHICNVKRCVNPNHLNPTSDRDNILRGTAPPAINARKTVCHQSHPLDGVDARGKRFCRTCASESLRRYRERSRDSINSRSRLRRNTDEYRANAAARQRARRQRLAEEACREAR